MRRHEDGNRIHVHDMYMYPVLDGQRGRTLSMVRIHVHCTRWREREDIEHGQDTCTLY